LRAASRPGHKHTRIDRAPIDVLITYSMTVQVGEEWGEEGKGARTKQAFSPGKDVLND